MSFKDDLMRFRDEQDDELDAYEEKTIFPRKQLPKVNLDDKVDEFIDWYLKNMVKGFYTDIGEYHAPRDMRNLIEKIAVWYELRYPSYEINRLMPGSGQEEINIDDVMFKNNSYINDLFDKKSDVRELEWNDFYNTSAFVKSLPWKERCYLNKPRYKSIVYLDSARLHLTRNGYVELAEGVEAYTKYEVSDEELIGLNIKDVVRLFKIRGIKLPADNELEGAINAYENWLKQKEGILDCAMYRIIERGGNRIGPRRGFLFAKEFNRNIDIPMMYGIDYSDPGLKLFINEYIKAGGSKELVCYERYFSRASKNKKIEKTVLKDVIINRNTFSSCTPEEKELYQKLVNAISSKIDYDIVKEEKTKQLRMERKLERK